MGIGCRRDPLEANVWYVRAADGGDERAKHRIAAIHAAASGGPAVPAKSTTPETWRTPSPVRKNKKNKGMDEETEDKKRKKWGIF